MTVVETSEVAAWILNDVDAPNAAESPRGERRGRPGRWLDVGMYAPLTSEMCQDTSRVGTTPGFDDRCSF